MNISINCPWLENDLYCEKDKEVCISVVAYEHFVAMPARLCAGLIPAITLSRQLAMKGVKSTIRVIDPSPIANYCNGWQTIESQFKGAISKFLTDNKVNFFFDEAEQVTDSAVEILGVLGSELEASNNLIITDIVGRIKESGRQHGGESGANNAILYMAAHPFSWLDMHHPLIWSNTYSPDSHQFVNLMSKPESRFTIIRDYLKGKRPDLLSGINATNHYMKICNTPCYIPLQDEPTFSELTLHGYEWCHQRYRELKHKSGNHRRALKDFESLVSFTRLGAS